MASLLIAAVIKKLSGKRVYAQFADSALAVYGTSFVVTRAELDLENQLFRLQPKGAEPWTFRYTDIVLLKSDQIVFKRGEEAVLRLEIATS